MERITIPAQLVSPSADRPLTPAMLTALWELAAMIDERRDLPEAVRDAVWIEAPSRRLRRAGREDNHWLREVLTRLLGVRITGQHRGDPWGATMLAQFEFVGSGERVRLLIPPAAIAALRAPATFARVEAEAAHRLTGHGRRLYVLLADRRRQGRPSWTYGVDELRELLGVSGAPSYGRFNAFRQRVLDPALAAIHDLGTVEVVMTPVREGRRVARIRFDWKWKSPQDAADTLAENARPRVARRRQQTSSEAPPLIAEADEKAAAAAWFETLSDDERERALEATEAWIDQAKGLRRRQSDRVLDAYRAVGEKGPGEGAPPLARPPEAPRGERPPEGERGD